MSSDEKLDEIIRRIGLMETGIQNLGTRVEALETDSTEKIIALIQQVREESKQHYIELKDSIHVLSKKIDIMNRELLEVKAEQERNTDRIDELERKPS